MALLNEANQAAARDSLGGLPRVISTLPFFRLLTGPDLSGVATVLGAVLPGDGNGGTYYWNPTDTSSDNGTTVIKPTLPLSGPGRWNLLNTQNGGGGGGGSTPVISTGSTVARTLSDRFTDIRNVADYGAVADGTTDNSPFFQAAVADLPAYGGILLIKAGTTFYSMTSGISFNGKNNVTIISNGAELRVANGYVDTQFGTWPNFGKDSIFRFVDNTGVEIQGPLILNQNIQNRTAHAGSESFNCCILLAGCTRVYIRDCVLKNSMTDGVCVVRDSVNATNTDIHVISTICDSNRRQGISLVDVTDCWIDRCRLINTGVSQGTAPMAGLDIEPDLTSGLPRISRVFVTKCIIDGNLGTYAVSVGGTGSNGVSIDDNDILFAKDFGISFDAYSSSYSSTACKLINNRFGVSASASGVQTAAIRAVSKNLDLIKGNTVSGAIIAGVTCYDADGLIIEENLFTGCVGVSANDVTLPFKRLHIRRNQFIDGTPVAAGSAWNVVVARPASTSAIIEFDENFVMNSVGAPRKTDGAAIVGGPCIALARWNTSYNLLNTYSVTDSNFTVWGSMAADAGPRFGAFVNGLKACLNFETGSLFVGDNVIGSASSAPVAAPAFGTTWNRGDLLINSLGGAGNPIGWISRSISATPSWDPWYSMLGSPLEGRSLLWSAGFLQFAAAPYTLMTTTTDLSLTGTTVETTSISKTLPGSTLTIGGFIEVVLDFTCTNNANTKTYRVKFGGTLVATIVLTNVASGTLTVRIGNRGATNVQIITATGVGGTVTVVSSAAIDTTVDQIILVTAQLANGTDSMALPMGRMTYNLP